MLNMAGIPFAICGVAAGIIAYLPLPLVLKPVMENRQNASMLMGVLALALSVAALVLFTLGVFALFGEAFRMFLAGEGIGFIAIMAVHTVRVVQSVRRDS